MGRVVTRYMEAKAGTWAIVIAWNGLFSFFPIVIVAVTLIGLVLRWSSPDAASSVENSIAQSLSQNHQQYLDILGIFESLKRQTGGFALVGVGALLWTGSALTGAFDQGLNALYPCTPRSFIKQKLMSVQVMLLFTVLMIPLMLSSALLSKLSEIPHLPAALSSAPVALVLQITVGSLDALLLFVATYYMIPYRRMRFRSVIPGAVVAGVLLELVTLLFPVYARISHGFSSYGAAFALFFLLLSYFYLVGQVIMIGATINAELDGDPGQCVEPQSEQEAEKGGLAMTHAGSAGARN